MKNIIITIKHSIDKLNGGLHTTEDRINGFEDQEKLTQNETHRDRGDEK